MEQAPGQSVFTVNALGSAVEVSFAGTWVIGQQAPLAVEILQAISRVNPQPDKVVLDTTKLAAWDSQFVSRALDIANWCKGSNIPLDDHALPAGASKLLQIATAVKPGETDVEREPPWFDLVALRDRISESSLEFISFVGGIHLALIALVRGKSNTRAQDFFYFVDQAGPRALGIVSLISVLVGMILAYMGAVQLRQFGAEIYVANLVAIGMAREMAPLMTAIIMAGRTGAAYAAQLGTMQTNEEIDATRTLGISPMEFLVTPRLLGLVVVMPLLVLYSDLLGIVGGGLVANGMGVSTVTYINQVQGAITWGDINAGLVKSLVFACLVGIAGCQAGLQCGRSSAAVGEATTTAVVRAIVYLIVADSALNVIYDKLGV